VSAYDYVFDFEEFHSVLEDSKAVHVGVNHQVGDVPMNKKLSGK
jgi:hypothetical protein